MEEISSAMKMTTKLRDAAIMHCPAMENSSSAWYSLVAAFCRRKKRQEERMVRMPTTITSARKNVAKPSTTIMPPKAGPSCVYAYTVAPSAATRATMLIWPKAFEDRLWSTGSRTIRSVPMTVRTISGRMRIRSAEVGPRSAGMRDLRGGEPALDAETGPQRQRAPRREGNQDFTAETPGRRGKHLPEIGL